MGFLCPLGEELHASVSDPFDEDVWPEPAGLGAGVSSRDFTVSSEGRHHSLDVVEALMRLLAGHGALDGISDKEDPNVHIWILGKLDCMAKRVVRALATIRTLI